MRRGRIPRPPRPSYIRDASRWSTDACWRPSRRPEQLPEHQAMPKIRHRPRCTTTSHVHRVIRAEAYLLLKEAAVAKDSAHREGGW